MLEKRVHLPQSFVDALDTRSAQPLTPDLSSHAVQLRTSAVTDTGYRPTKRELEAQIRGNDFLDVNYLRRGLMATRAVCRIEFDNGDTATGFLVGPGLLLTNHHVLSTPEAAATVRLRFDYEYDEQGTAVSTTEFALDPQAGFWTVSDDAAIDSPPLDFTLVAVQPLAEDGTSIEDYGFLRLQPNRGKTDAGLCVTIIGHPGGHHKQISLRDNKVLAVGSVPGLPSVEHADALLWYDTDTLPGSSGSPVFNDLFQVVALHHAGVPRRREQDGKVQYLLARAEPTDEEVWVSDTQAARLPSEALSWVANEGIRISSLVEHMRQIARQESESGKRQLLERWLDDLSNLTPYPNTRPKTPIVMPEAFVHDLERRRPRQPRARNTRPLSYYEGYDRLGYDPDFLGLNLPLPNLDEAIRKFGPAAEVHGGGVELKYTNFSIVLSQTRRLAYLTAVNIDGGQSQNLGRDDTWYYDPRVSEALQVGDEVYSNEPMGNYFDRGHLVRRLDPVWGPQADRANVDTFHWTNCSPQYWEFNQKDVWWQGLENFILLTTDQENLRATVFTGPVFASDDTPHRGIQVPSAYWKVVAVLDDSGRLTSSAYVVSQKRWVDPIPFERARLPVGPVRNFQVSIKHLETLTGIDFGEGIRTGDVFQATRDGQERRELHRLADVTHSRRRGGDRSGASPSTAPLRERLHLADESVITTRNGRRVLVEVDTPRLGEMRGAEFNSSGSLTRVSMDLDAALKNARPVLQAVADFLSELNNPNEISLQLGLKLNAEANVILAQLKSEGSIGVTLKWSKASR